MNNEIIRFDGISVSVVRSSRRRSLSLQVSNAGIIARVPARMPLKTIEAFVASKEQWLRKQQAKLPLILPPIKLITGAEIPYLDSAITLSVIEGKRGTAQLRNEQLLLPVLVSRRDIELTTKAKLVRWYKAELKRLLEQKIKHYAQLLNVEPNELKIRDYKRRWGSCSSKKDLSFNWRLIMAPEHVIDYVVLHELAHIIEFNHSKRFWSIVVSIMPDWKEKKAWLNEHGRSLYRI